MYYCIKEGEFVILHCTTFRERQHPRETTKTAKRSLPQGNNGRWYKLQLDMETTKVPCVAPASNERTNIVVKYNDSVE
jgi:hypothetical protein